MIYLLHGDNVEASRVELMRLKKQFENREVRSLTNSDQLTLTQLTQALESSSLFGGDTAVFIENLFTRLTKKKKELEAYATIILSNAKNVDCILWEEKEMGVTVLKLLGSSVKIQLFKYSAIIFQLLDGIKPGNGKQLLSLYDAFLEKESAELLFAMLVRRIRQLIMLRDGVTLEGLAGWQSSRLTTQAKLFTMDKLLQMERKLLAIDTTIKQGLSAFDYKDHIAIFLAQIS